MIRGRHGLYIPPRRKKKRDQFIILHFVIPGAIPSKKNRLVPVISNRKWFCDRIRELGANNELTVGNILENFKQVHGAIINSTEYQVWEQATKHLLLDQAKEYLETYKDTRILFPLKECSIKIYHYWKDNVARDNSNKAEGIHDVLKMAGIIEDDTWQCLSPTCEDAGNYHGEILDHITEIHVTAYRW